MRKAYGKGIVMLGLILLSGLWIAACKPECPCPPPPPPPVIKPVPQFIMMTSMESVDIKAPVEKVFKAVEDPNNLPKFDKGFTISNIQGSGLGQTFHWVMSIDKLRLEGDCMVVSFIPNKSMTFINTISETFNFIFLSNPDGTTKLSATRQNVAMFPDDTEATKQAVTKQETDWFKAFVNGIKTEVESGATVADPAPAPEAPKAEPPKK